MDVIHTFFRTKCPPPTSAPLPVTLWPLLAKYIQSPGDLCSQGGGPPQTTGIPNSRWAANCFSRDNSRGSWGPSASLLVGDLPAPITEDLSSCSARSCPRSLNPNGGQMPLRALGPAPSRAAAGRLWDREACPCSSLDLSFFVCVLRGLDS